MSIPVSATDSHQRVRLRLNGLVLHATVIPGTYDPEIGAFQASFDTDAAGTPPSVFTPVAPQTSPATYTDQNGLIWELIN
jgi:hypothetical protein